MASSRPTYLSPFASRDAKNASTVTTIVTDASDHSGGDDKHNNEGEKSRRGSKIKSKLSKMLSASGSSAPSSKATSTATSRAPSTAPSVTASETEDLSSSNEDDGNINTTSPSSRGAHPPATNETEWLAGRKYILRVNAGPSYDASTHTQVQVNSGVPLTIQSEHMTVKLNVRIKDYVGLPRGSPTSTTYFDSPQHKNDRYSISFSFIPKRDIPSQDLIWGNDFDHPIRERLPPGFNTAFKIVKTFIDPGLSCDAYADEPWLYGPALSCWFVFRIGEKTTQSSLSASEGTATTAVPATEKKEPLTRSSATAEQQRNDNGGDAPAPLAKNIKEKEGQEEAEIITEGADDTSGAEIRASIKMPDAADKRRKFFLTPENRAKLVFEKGRKYYVDFFNPYLDFNKFALRLPGFSLSVIKYIDDKTHNLRYVFKSQTTGEVYLVVVFTLLFGQELLDAVREPAVAAASVSEARRASNGEDENQEQLRQRAQDMKLQQDGNVKEAGGNAGKEEDARSTRSDDSLD